MKEQYYKGHFPFKQGTDLNVQLSVLFYEEDGIHYAYCAALDILGYGYTEKEAKDSFEVMVRETLTDAVSNGTLVALLQSCGWNKNQPPTTSNLINSNHELANIVNNKDYKAVIETVRIPVA